MRHLEINIYTIKMKIMVYFSPLVLLFYLMLMTDTNELFNTDMAFKHLANNFGYLPMNLVVISRQKFFRMSTSHFDL